MRSQKKLDQLNGKNNIVIKKINMYQFLAALKLNVWTNLMFLFCSENFLEYSIATNTLKYLSPIFIKCGLQ